MAVPELFLYSLVIGSAGCAALSVSPVLSHVSSRVVGGGLTRYQKGKVEKATKELDDIFLDVKPKWMKFAYGIGPISAGGLAFVLTNSAPLAFVGAIVGIVVPDLWVRNVKAVRRKKFHAQLVDALFILSSSLRAGLSLPQAFEQLANEMSPPSSQEYGLVVKAHRLGRTLEYALEGLNQRIQSDDLRLVTTALLLARETGGDVTSIIQQLIVTIRERKKLHDKVTTLTVQGRFQAYIMSALPVIFALFVRSFNPEYFRLLLTDTFGQLALALACVLWLVGIILLMIMSKVEF